MTEHLSECCQHNQQDREFNGAQTNHEYQMVLNVGNLYTSLNLNHLINSNIYIYLTLYTVFQSLKDFYDEKIGAAECKTTREKTSLKNGRFLVFL